MAYGREKWWSLLKMVMKLSFQKLREFIEQKKSF